MNIDEQFKTVGVDKFIGSLELSFKNSFSEVKSIVKVLTALRGKTVWTEKRLGVAQALSLIVLEFCNAVVNM